VFILLVFFVICYMSITELTLLTHMTRVQNFGYLVI